MAGLTAGFASAVFLAQRTIALGAFQTITGRRFTAVGTVFVESPLQLGDTGLLLSDAGLELVHDPANHFNNRIHATLIEGSLDDGA